MSITTDTCHQCKSTNLLTRRTGNVVCLNCLAVYRRENGRLRRFLAKSGERYPDADGIADWPFPAARAAGKRAA